MKDTGMKIFYKNYIKSIRPKSILWCLLASISFCLTYFLVFSYVNLLSVGVGKLFEFLYAICLSYIAAFIFYILTVHIPKVKKKQNVEDVVYNCCGKMYWFATIFAKNISEVFNIKFDSPIPTIEELDALTEDDFSSGKAKWDEYRIRVIPLLKANISKVQQYEELFPEISFYVNYISDCDFINPSLEHIIKKDFLENKKNSLPLTKTALQELFTSIYAIDCICRKESSFYNEYYPIKIDRAAK